MPINGLEPAGGEKTGSWIIVLVIVLFEILRNKDVLTVISAPDRLCDHPTRKIRTNWSRLYRILQTRLWFIHIPKLQCAASGELGQQDDVRVKFKHTVAFALRNVIF